MSSNYLYLRGVRKVDYTVFAVTDGQKQYYDPVIGRRLPYSSGQQVKRSILDTFVDELGDGELRAPITFNYELATKKGKQELSQKEPWNPCDPSYADQLLGGYMRAQTGIGTVKRRSPLSISAMRPLHPLLANLTNSESGTFDRSDDPNRHPVRVRDENGNEIPEEEVLDFLRRNDRNLNRRSWLDLGPRASGLFVYDIAINLQELFRVTDNVHEPALTDETREKLEGLGWTASDGYLYAPREMQERIVKALPNALIDWRITSNQSRTFSPQPTLAVAVTAHASRVADVIRGDLRDDQPLDKPKALPIIETNIPGVETFVALGARSVIAGIEGRADALEAAAGYVEGKLREAMV